MARLRPFRLIRPLFLLPLTLLAGGCGRPATEAECREILEKAARLELESRMKGSAQLVDTEVKGLEESLRPAMMEKCVGKRITESALRCVRGAKTSEELFDQCLE